MSPIELFRLSALLLVLDTAVAAMAPPPRPPLPDGVFPIGVWLQQPKHARSYRDLGINLYVGLWKGPTAGQLEALREAGMPVICEQNDVALAERYAGTVVGWLQPDEPDNAQPLPGVAGVGRAWGPPLAPGEVRARYERMRAKDPSRPVFLNLGKGVAWDRWKGRGRRTGHREDYPEYVKAADIVAFDIYPAAETDPALAGRLELVAHGVERLVDWAGPARTVWMTIGASRVNNPRARVDPAQVRSQVWMSIIRGSRGITYFVHQFEPTFVEASWFEDPALARSIARINAEVQGLARVILDGDPRSIAVVKRVQEQDRPAPPDRLAIASRRLGCETYLFAASLSPRPLHARIELDVEGDPRIEVLGERRAIEAVNGGYPDRFGPYAVHLYRVAGAECAE